MKKYLLTIPILILMITGVFAMNYNVIASQKNATKENGNLIFYGSGKLNAWHNDGRAPTYNPNSWFNHNGVKTHYSNGISPSGKGTLELVFQGNNYQENSIRVTINCNLIEFSNSVNGSLITSNNNAICFGWVKNALLPTKIPFTNVTYTYNIDTKLVKIYFEGYSIDFDLLAL